MSVVEKRERQEGERERDRGRERVELSVVEKGREKRERE